MDPVGLDQRQERIVKAIEQAIRSACAEINASF